MPIPMARFMVRGTARTTACRSPVATRRVMTMPSATITPMACG